MVPVPFVGIAGSMVLGIVAAWYGVITPESAWAFSGIFFLAGVALYAWRARPGWGYAAALVAIAAASGAWYSCRTAECRSAGLRTLLGGHARLVRVRGYVSSAPQVHVLPKWWPTDEERRCTRFVMNVSDALLAGQWRPAPGLMRVTVEGVTQNIGYGHQVDLVARAQPTSERGASIRASAGMLASEGIGATGWAAAPEAITVKTGSAGWPGLRLIERARARLLQAVDQRLEGDAAAIVKCLVLGERQGLGEDLQDAFRRTGTMHFLAVSGLHVGLLAAFVWYAALLCGVRHRQAAAVVMGIVFLYAALAGFSPSVRRAAVMTAVVCGSWLFGLKPRLPSSLALALALILLHTPSELFRPGLQLSFAAVCGIVAFTRPLHRTLFRAPDAVDRLSALKPWQWRRRAVTNTVQQLFAVSVAAWLATLPLTLAWFHLVSFSAPVANLVLVPAVWLTLAAGFPGAGAAAVTGKYAWPLLATSASGAGVMAWFVRLLARVPYVAVHLPPPGWWWVGLCYALMLAIAARQHLRLNRWRIVSLMLLPGVVYLAFVWRAPAPERMRVTAIPVGHGNCMLAQFPDGKTLLFDAGSMGFLHVGKNVITPALWAQGVRRLDAVILSHHDADHYNGFLQVADMMPVGKVCLPVGFDRHPSAAPFMAELEQRGLAIERLAAGDRIAGFADADARVLWPVRGLLFAKKLSDNELCCVVHLTQPEGSALLTGDIGGRGAALMLSRVKSLSADIFQVPHHGIINPEGLRLAAAARPRVGIVPCGRSAWQPEPWTKLIKHLLSTDKEGMIEIELGGTGGLRVRTSKRSFVVGARREATGD